MVEMDGGNVVAPLLPQVEVYAVVDRACMQEAADEMRYCAMAVLPDSLSTLVLMRSSSGHHFGLHGDARRCRHTLPFRRTGHADRPCASVRIKGDNCRPRNASPASDSLALKSDLAGSVGLERASIVPEHVAPGVACTAIATAFPPSTGDETWPNATDRGPELVAGDPVVVAVGDGDATDDAPGAGTQCGSPLVIVPPDIAHFHLEWVRIG